MTSSRKTPRTSGPCAHSFSRTEGSLMSHDEAANIFLGVSSGYKARHMTGESKTDAACPLRLGMYITYTQTSFLQAAVCPPLLSPSVCTTEQLVLAGQGTDAQDWQPLGDGVRGPWFLHTCRERRPVARFRGLRRTHDEEATQHGFPGHGEPAAFLRFERRANLCRLNFLLLLCTAVSSVVFLCEMGLALAPLGLLAIFRLPALVTHRPQRALI